MNLCNLKIGVIQQNKFMDINNKINSDKMSLYSPFRCFKNAVTKEYSVNEFKSDIVSGIIVALVAIPLGLSLAIAAGVSPEVGLYTIITAGLLSAILGGSKFQITGPTAAFVAILLPISNTYGYQGLIFTTFLAGLILIIMGYCRFGKVIQYIPYPVTTGFTSGIGFVIMSLQIKDFLGLEIPNVANHFFERVLSLVHFLPSFSIPETITGVSTLTLLIIWKKFNKKIPAPIVVLPFVSILCFAITSYFSDINISTIMTSFSNIIDGSVVHGIPHSLPKLILPWDYFSGESFLVMVSKLRLLILPAFIIAILASIESLLSAVVADGITNTKHDSNAELIGLGIGNVFGSFLGSIPATGAIARTATNIRFGGKTQIAATVHSLTVLFIIIFAATVISYIPMAALAALLVIVSFEMMDISRFKKILITGPKSDAFVLLVTFLLTILFDMVIGVCVGIVLAAFLFMKRMADVTCGCIVPIENSNDNINIDADNIICYKINGPLFFGAADKAVKVISNIMGNVDTIIFIMDSVSAIDITGLTVLEHSVKELQQNKKNILFVGVQEQPLKVLIKSDIIKLKFNLNHFDTLEQAIAIS